MNQKYLQYEAKTSIFRTLWAKPNKTSSADLIHLFSDCIRAASSRTKEYLLFRDPENKFHPSPSTLSEIFLMTYIQHSSLLNLSDTFNCTAMTQEQRILLSKQTAVSKTSSDNLLTTGGMTKTATTDQAAAPTTTKTTNQPSAKAASANQKSGMANDPSTKAPPKENVKKNTSSDARKGEAATSKNKETLQPKK